MSAVFTALAVAVTFGIIRDLTGDYIGAAAGALTLAFASTVWANATWATSYGMNLFFTAVVIRCMLEWWRTRDTKALVLAALAFGLGLCNHRLIVLVAPSSVMLLMLGWRSLAPKSVALSLLAFLAGLSVYLYLPIRGEMEPALSWAQPAEWRTYWSMFVNGQTPGGHWSIDFRDRIDILWEYPSYDLTWAGLLLAAVGFGVCVVRTQAVAAFFGLMIVLDAMVVQTYAIHNIYNYLTPGYLALCVFMGVAAAWAVERVQGGSGGRPSREPARCGGRSCGGARAVAGVPAVSEPLQRVDQSGDYNAYDFARTTLDHMPQNAVILTDSWTASSLWYAQLVEGYRRDVLVSPVFSIPGDGVHDFVQDQFDEGRQVYVAEGLRVNAVVLSDEYTVQPIVLDSIARMVTEALPKPEYRDDLVMTGTLYKVVEGEPEMVSAEVPAGSAVEIAFGTGVSLVGMQSDASEVARGDVVQLTYYWRADRNLDIDLSAATLFFDSAGVVAETLGFPLWSQNRTIGEGVAPTSGWQAGEITREAYYSLVPRELAPGTYDVRIAVFDAASPTAAADARQLVNIGTIVVR